jgi:hypothetical protein
MFKVMKSDEGFNPALYARGPETQAGLAAHCQVMPWVAASHNSARGFQWVFRTAAPGPLSRELTAVCRHNQSSPHPIQTTPPHSAHIRPLSPCQHMAPDRAGGQVSAEHLANPCEDFNLSSSCCLCGPFCTCPSRLQKSHSQSQLEVSGLSGQAMDPELTVALPAGF